MHRSIIKGDSKILLDAGVCTRSFYVGDVTPEDVKAKYKSGVLTIVLPKKEQKKLNSTSILLSSNFIKERLVAVFSGSEPFCVYSAKAYLPINKISPLVLSRIAK